tara:strand:+ start:122 stop:607 length:486 start_codon:yes stop_codon:yes gene_type:complete
LILIALGSNLKSETYGDPIQNCHKAMEFLEERFELEKVSNFYETEPIPKSNQEMYVNGVVSVKTKLLPNKILSELMNIEKIFKRVRSLKNESRVIDLDLLCYNEIVLKDKHLELPHPRMHLRRFVMQPLCDINKEWVHPLLKEKAKNILKNLANQKIYNIN